MASTYITLSAIAFLGASMLWLAILYARASNLHILYRLLFGLSALAIGLVSVVMTFGYIIEFPLHWSYMLLEGIFLLAILLTATRVRVELSTPVLRGLYGFYFPGSAWEKYLGVVLFSVTAILLAMTFFVFEDFKHIPSSRVPQGEVGEQYVSDTAEEYINQTEEGQRTPVAQPLAPSQQGARPSLLTIFPSEGPIGTEVVLKGTNFDRFLNVVSFGPTDINMIDSMDETSLTFFVPGFSSSGCTAGTKNCNKDNLPREPIVPGTYEVAVKTVHGVSNTLPFVVWNSYTYSKKESQILPDITFNYPIFFGNGPTLISSRITNRPQNISEDWAGFVQFRQTATLNDGGLRIEFFKKVNSENSLEGYVSKSATSGGWGSPKYFQAGSYKAARIRFASSSHYDADLGWYFIELPDKSILAISTSGEKKFLYDDDFSGNSTRDKIISTLTIAE